MYIIVSRRSDPYYLTCESVSYKLHWNTVFLSGKNLLDNSGLPPLRAAT